MVRSRNELEAIRLKGTQLLHDQLSLPRRLSLVPVESNEARLLFDDACEKIHYAGACRRVGRRFRLAIISKGEWVGGFVLGSPFPNLRARDDAFGLTRWVLNWEQRRLASPWASENEEYWRRLQQIVNHARAFVFSAAQGRGIGIRAHSLLESEGSHYWRARYGGRVAGFDTLCNHASSRLFAANRWNLVGRTAGYRRDPSITLSRRALNQRRQGDNAGLSPRTDGVRWWIWVRKLRLVRL